jgi:ubiquinone/menaquinone biosynthesis C-methylase UbiE
LLFQTLQRELIIPTVAGPDIFFLGPMGNSDPIEFINQETNQIPFKDSIIDSNAWKNTFRTWPHIPAGWRNWYRRVEAKKGPHWLHSDLHQCITLSLSDLKKNEPMLIAVSYFWLNSTNTFMFGHGPMTITLADILMLTSLKITRSINPHDF